MRHKYFFQPIEIKFDIQFSKTLLKQNRLIYDTCKDLKHFDKIFEKIEYLTAGEYYDDFKNLTTYIAANEAMILAIQGKFKEADYIITKEDMYWRNLYYSNANQAIHKGLLLQ